MVITTCHVHNMSCAQHVYMVITACHVHNMCTWLSQHIYMVITTCHMVITTYTHSYHKIYTHGYHGVYHTLSYHQLKIQWDGKNREVLLANNRLEQSSHHKLLVEVKELQEEIGV